MEPLLNDRSDTPLELLVSERRPRERTMIASCALASGLVAFVLILLLLLGSAARAQEVLQDPSPAQTVTVEEGPNPLSQWASVATTISMVLGGIWQFMVRQDRREAAKEVARKEERTAILAEIKVERDRADALIQAERHRSELAEDRHREDWLALRDQMGAGFAVISGRVDALEAELRKA